MAKNRKSQSAGLIFGPALKAALICGFILVCCVGYVWQKKQIAELSHQIRNGEKHLAELRDKNDQLRNQIAMLLSTPALRARATDPKLNLGLVLPQPSQIWRLPEPQPETAASHLAPKIEQQFAAGRNGGPTLP